MNQLLTLFITLLLLSCIVSSYARYLHNTVSQTQQVKWPTLDGVPPILFGHTGERFYLPEHTSGSYKLAAIEGADYVEPDIVLTKDRIPVCYHDIALKRSTDIESRPEFAALRGNHNVIIDGKNKTIYDDWLVIHLTLDELKTLRIQQQPNGVRLQDFNDLYEIITFQEFLDAIHEISFKLGKPIGIIPELKHPVFHNTVFNQQERFMETLLLSMLQTNGYPLNNGDASNCKYNSEPISCGPIILQNFDKNTVQYFSTVTSYPIVELMTLIHPDVYLLTPRGFEEIANFTHYICLWKEYMYTGVELEIIFRDWEEPEMEIIDFLGGFYKPEEFLPAAHRLGVKLTLFTIPDSRENSGRGCAITIECDPINKEEEMFYYFDMGIDGMFVENIPESLMLRMKYDYELQIANLTRHNF